MIDKLTGAKPFALVYLDGNGDVEGYDEFDTREEAESEFAQCVEPDRTGSNPDPTLFYMRLARTVQPPMVIERCADGTL